MKIQLSVRVTNASIIAAAMVVGIHVSNCQDVGSLLWWWEAMTHYGVFLIAVPFFFTCSGYFLARHYVGCEGATLGVSWWREMCKRLRSLFVPYVLWSAIAAAVPLGLVLFANLLHGRELVVNLPSIGWRECVYIFGLHPFAWPSLVPLWYVRALLIFVFLSPVVYVAIKKWGGGVLCIYLYNDVWRCFGKRIVGCLGGILSQDIFADRSILYLPWHVAENSRGEWDSISTLSRFVAEKDSLVVTWTYTCDHPCRFALHRRIAITNPGRSPCSSSPLGILEFPARETIPRMAYIVGIPDIFDSPYHFAFALADGMSLLACQMGNWFWRRHVGCADFATHLPSGGLTSLWRSVR